MAHDPGASFPPTPTTYDPDMELNGSGTVVTGASGGIGDALVRRFHAAGAKVVACDVNNDGISALATELNAIRPNSVFAVTADLSTEDGNRELVSVARHFLEADGGPGIDLFFANAGVGGGTLLESTTESQWDLAFAVNVHAHRWAMKHLIGDWLARGRGYFCSTASAAGLLSQIGSGPYSVTKHAAVAFAEWVSITYGDRGVKVSCLCPQGVNTNMLRQSDDSGFAGATNVVRAAGVVLEPSDVADVVAQAIADERFLILPHPEVADYEQRKAADRERWLAGMRKLQARVFGSR
jgi:NAD(P)-dependent dehydrogenase (short-subunit alcohol dehydrogenase family)